MEYWDSEIIFYRNLKFMIQPRCDEYVDNDEFEVFYRSALSSATGRSAARDVTGQPRPGNANNQPGEANATAQLLKSECSSLSKTCRRCNFTAGARTQAR